MKFDPFDGVLLEMSIFSPSLHICVLVKMVTLALESYTLKCGPFVQVALEASRFCSPRKVDFTVSFCFFCYVIARRASPVRCYSYLSRVGLFSFDFVMFCVVVGFVGFPFCGCRPCYCVAFVFSFDSFFDLVYVLRVAGIARVWTSLCGFRLILFGGVFGKRRQGVHWVVNEILFATSNGFRTNVVFICSVSVDVAQHLVNQLFYTFGLF